MTRCPGFDGVGFDGVGFDGLMFLRVEHGLDLRIRRAGGMAVLVLAFNNARRGW